MNTQSIDRSATSCEVIVEQQLASLDASVAERAFEQRSAAALIVARESDSRKTLLKQMHEFVGAGGPLTPLEHVLIDRLDTL